MSSPNSTQSWIACQIGAREHYAIPRALHRAGGLQRLATDFWVPPHSVLGVLPFLRRLKDRYHTDLEDAVVKAPNVSMLCFELAARTRSVDAWDRIMERNRRFQQRVLDGLSGVDSDALTTLFSYAYAARDLFHHADQRGWIKILGQIDPGPEEERMVADEHERYPQLKSTWQPAPASYWDSWREELDLADHVIVNSEWSRQCLLREGLPHEKLKLVPLVHEDAGAITGLSLKDGGPKSKSEKHRLLFLGQINLRKGIGRLLDAMRMLEGEPIELTLVGPTEICPSAWEESPNVTWAGPAPRSEVNWHYDQADAFILPTLSDGYALTQLEALSRGLPVIASRNCGAVVEHGVNGLLLEDLEPETIAAVISKSRSACYSKIGAAPDFGLDELAAKLLALSNSNDPSEGDKPV